MIEEEWRDIPTYDGRYQVSSLGRVRGFIDSWARRKQTPHLLKPQQSHGYLFVGLRHESGGRQLPLRIHTAVLLAFHGPRPSPEHEAAHNNGIRRDNRIDNLRWATAAENAADRDEHGHTVWGTRTNTSKLSPLDVIAIRKRFASGERQAVIARSLGVSPQAICYIVHGRNWSRLQDTTIIQ